MLFRVIFVFIVLSQIFSKVSVNLLNWRVQKLVALIQVSFNGAELEKYKNLSWSAGFDKDV